MERNKRKNFVIDSGLLETEQKKDLNQSEKEIFDMLKVFKRICTDNQ